MRVPGTMYNDGPMCMRMSIPTRRVLQLAKAAAILRPNSSQDGVDATETPS